MSDLDTHERFLRVVSQLTAAVSNTRLYSLDHPYVEQYADAAYTELRDLLRWTRPFTFFLVGDSLVIKDRPLVGGGQFVEKFVSMLQDKGVERVTFDDGLTKSELLDFITGLAAKGDVSVRSSLRIRLGKVELRLTEERKRKAEGDHAGEEGAETCQEPVVHGELELDRIRELYHTVERRKKMDVRGVDAIVRRFITGFLWNINPIRLLASVKSAHEYTFTHAVNVGILTLIQARNLGYTGRRLHEIGIASMLHDVGKIFVPEDILSKPGRLTPEERVVIETHTVKGGRYLMTLPNIPKIAVIAALEHHRKYDGTGYPHLTQNWRPNIVGQLIAIADVFDALRSTRSYSPAKPLGEIMQIFSKERGVAFHPMLVDSFVRLIGPSPLQASQMN
jgi:HD-GYP domain-containing protein (c-di-GMP phosphodiesterase class II)